MIRRHFFLASALILLAIMAVAGSLKVAALKSAGATGSTEVGGGPAGRSGTTRPDGSGGPAMISAVFVTPHAFQDTIEVLGVAKGRQSVTLTAATTQLVDKVRFSDGQHVPRGAVLIELKNTEQDAGIDQAEARLLQAQRAYERYRQLGEKGFASKAAVDQYEAAYRSAQADLAAAHARENDRIIRAPFAGVVGLSDVVPGALVNPGAPIVTLDDLSAVRVDFQVPERYLSQVQAGQFLTATIDALPGQTFRGRVAKLDTRVDERTRAITARAEFPNPDHRLKPGMLVRVGVSRGVRESLSLPESAVSMQGDAAFVYVIRAVDRRLIAEQRPVVLGARQEGLVEILEGLRPGERAVADGLNKIMPGQPVRVVGAAGGQGPSASGAHPPGPRPSA